MGQSNFVPDFDRPCPFSNVARGHLRHSNPNESTSSMGGSSLAWLGDHGASGGDSEPGLEINHCTGGITQPEVGVVSRGAIIGKNDIVSAFKYLASQDVVFDGAVPAIIVRRAKERLIN